MNKTIFNQIDNPILVNTEGLKDLTQSGRQNAIAIGIAAGARVKVGKSVRWNVSRVRAYLDSIATE